MNHIHHICIQTNDYAKSLAFYQKLGFNLKKEDQNFHGRAYNSWLELNGFYIELQTGKKQLNRINLKDITGIVHFCLYVDDLECYLNNLDLNKNDFFLKDDQVIYQVYDTKLAKVQAPEGTIIEFRDTNIF